MSVQKKTFYSIKWNSILVFSSRFVSFGIGIVLARILAPADFGLIAMANVFVALTGVLANAGLGSAIIQREELTKEDLSTIFWMNIGAGFVFSILLFFLADALASFYNEPRVASVVQYLSLQPFINSLSIVPINLMVREISLKKRTISQLTGQLIAAAVSVVMAILGYGVLALIMSVLLSSGISTILYLWQSGWKPLFVFQYQTLKQVWGYSSKVFYGNLLQQTVQRVDEFILGKFVTAFTLGLYNRAKSLADLPAQMIGQVLTRSFFPILSRMQDDPEPLRAFYIQQSKKIGLLSISFFFFLILMADVIIELLLGEPWMEVVPYFRLALVIAMIYVNNAFKVYLLNSINKPAIVLRQSLVLAPVRMVLYTLPLLLWSKVDPFYILWVSIAVYFVGFVWIVKSIANCINIGFVSQLIPYIVYCGVYVLSVSIAQLVSLTIEYEVVAYLVRIISFLSCSCFLLFLIKDTYFIRITSNLKVYIKRKCISY